MGSNPTLSASLTTTKAVIYESVGGAKLTKTMQQLISLKNISQIFGLSDATTVALDQADLSIEQGEFVAIMGQSGSGKTSLLNIIGLIDAPTQGLYAFSGRETTALSARQKAKMRQKQIGFVFQNYNLLSEMTILDNVCLPLVYAGNYGFLRKVRMARKLLERLGIHKKEFLYPHQLSGGQIQRVAIARALINQPEILIADEPTGNLDSANSEVVMKILQGINKDGGTIIIATHNPALTKYASRIIYIQDGRIRIDQKLRKNQQVDLGKMQDAIKRQDVRQVSQSRSRTKSKPEAPALKRQKAKAASRKRGAKKQ